MAYTFPLSVAQFFGGLRIRSCDLELPSSIEVSKNADGEVIQSEYGARLWRGPVYLAAEYNRAAEKVRAKIQLLRGANRSFFATPYPVCYPAYDPDGSILGATLPTIHTLVAGNREMRLTGLPAGYKLTAGDFLSFSYRSLPTRYALHQVLVDVTADGAGLTPVFEVVPNIRSGAITGTSVHLIKPFFKAILVESEVGQQMGNRRDGMVLNIQQTLR